MERIRHERGATQICRVRRKKHGIKMADYALMLEVQKNACGICQKPQSEFTRALAVDHDHATGRVRGLLCANCNTAIGLLRDSREAIARAYRWVMTDEEIAAEQ